MSLYYQYFDDPASGDFVNYQIDLGPSRYQQFEEFGVGFCNIPTGELGRITETGIAEFHTGAFNNYINKSPFKHTYASDFEEGSDVDPMKGTFYLTGDISSVDFVTAFTGKNSRMYDQDNNLFYSYGDLFQSPFSIAGNIHEYYQNYSVNGIPVNSDMSRGCSENISGFYYTNENLQYQISVRDSALIEKWEPSETGHAQDIINFDASVTGSFEIAGDKIESWSSTDDKYTLGKWNSLFYERLEDVVSYDIRPKMNDEVIACKDSLYFDNSGSTDFTGFMMAAEPEINLKNNFAIMVVASYSKRITDSMLSFGSRGVKGSFSLNFDGSVDYNDTAGAAFEFGDNDIKPDELNLFTFVLNVEGFDENAYTRKNFTTYLNGLKTSSQRNFFGFLPEEDLPDSNCEIKLMSDYKGDSFAASSGAIAELIILTNMEDETLNDQTSKINIFEGYLAHKWNIDNKLFYSHPYSHGYPPVFKAGLKGGPLENLFGAYASNYTHL